MPQGGYAGKFLDVNLTTGALTPVTLPDEVLETWLGCAGLGLHLFAQECTPDMRPDDPGVPIFLLTGPITGTLAPSSSNWTIVTLNTVTPYHPAVSHSHGHLGARLKHAGWDGVFIRGVASGPTYLWIDDGHVELRDASALWGENVFETQRRIHLELGDPDRISVACIGPGGEAGMPGASVRADRAYGCSKGGTGTVWGAKRLKAIAVRGTGQVPIAQPDAFLETCDAWRETLKPYADAFNASGIRDLPWIAKFGGFPGRNFSDPEYAARWGAALKEHLKAWRIQPVGSWNCDLQCHNETYITTGPFAGNTVSGYTGEVIEELGPNIGIQDPGTALMLCGYVDGLGLDCGELPRIVAMVMEAFNAGRLTLEDTDGIDLTWGNYEGIVELMERTVRKEGIGATLARGLREAAQDLGIEDLAMHIKGVGFNTHDQRAWGVGWLFGSLMSGIGPSWQGVGFERMPEPDLGYPQRQDASDPTDKGRQSYLSQTKKMLEDCTGLCWFGTWRQAGSVDFLAKAVSQATGWPFDRDRALLLGERLIVLQRLISLHLGFDPQSEFDVAPRMAAPVPSGPAQGRALGPHLRQMREEYYATARWDPDTGHPTPQALARVGLADYRVGAP